MGISKNFKITNGLEVNTNLIFADTDSNKVGIATTIINYNLHVNGGIGVTNLTVTGLSTFNNLDLTGYVSIAGTTGQIGQSLVSTGIGVTWSKVSKTSSVFTATLGQSIFNFSYEVGSVEVYINGVRLSPNEFTATDGSTIVLNDSCFGGETVEILGIVFIPDIINGWTPSTGGGLYTISSVGIGTTDPTSKLTVDGNGLFTGIITASSFSGNASSSTYASTSGISTYSSVAGIATYASSSGIATYANTSGISTYSNSSGIATYSDISGISTYSISSGVSTSVIGGIGSISQLSVSGIVTATQGFISVGNTTPIQISLVGNQLTFTAVGIGSTTLTLF